MKPNKKAIRKGIVIFRYITTLVFIWMIYRETGAWTAVSLALLWIAIEFLGAWISEVNSRVRKLENRIEDEDVQE